MNWLSPNSQYFILASATLTLTTSTDNRRIEEATGQNLPGNISPPLGSQNSQYLDYRTYTSPWQTQCQQHCGHLFCQQHLQHKMSCHRSLQLSYKIKTCSHLFDGHLCTLYLTLTILRPIRLEAIWKSEKTKRTNLGTQTSTFSSRSQTKKDWCNDFLSSERNGNFGSVSSSQWIAIIGLLPSFVENIETESTPLFINWDAIIKVLFHEMPHAWSRLSACIPSPLFPTWYEGLHRAQTKCQTLILLLGNENQRIMQTSFFNWLVMYASRHWIFVSSRQSVLGTI